MGITETIQREEPNLDLTFLRFLGMGTSIKIQCLSVHHHSSRIFIFFLACVLICYYVSLDCIKYG